MKIPTKLETQNRNTWWTSKVHLDAVIFLAIVILVYVIQWRECEGQYLTFIITPLLVGCRASFIPRWSTRILVHDLACSRKRRKITAQNMDKFEKQVQTVGSVHLLISKYRQTGEKKTRLRLVQYFQHACLYLEIRGRTLIRVWTII